MNVKSKKLCISFIGLLFIYIFIFKNGADDLDYSVPNVAGCRPASRKIAFLKTFKCGTTTIIKMFQQYVKKFNLTMVEVDLNKIRTGPFSRSFLTNPSNKGDLLKNHFIWNRDEVVALMGSDVIALTILRNPIDVFESFYSFKNLKKELGFDSNEFIRQVLRKNDPMNWRNSSDGQKINRALYDYSISRTLGLPIESIQDDAAIDNYITKIEKEIDLFMIQERMDESMILFRYLLCWKLEDVVSFDHFVRPSDQVVQLGYEDKKELSKWLKADLKIYKHFYKVFEERVASYPGNMALEVQKRIDIREERRNYCHTSRNDTLECHGYLFTKADTRQHPIETGPDAVLENGQPKH